VLSTMTGIRPNQKLVVLKVRGKWTSVTIWIDAEEPVFFLLVG
jgi:hypothetical protein